MYNILYISRCASLLSRRCPSISYSRHYGSASDGRLERAVAEAERVVGYSPSYIGLKYLLSDEMSNVIPQLRRLVGTGHPIVQITKELLKTDHSSMQMRGLVVLLVGKIAGTKKSTDQIDNDLSSSISCKQKSLAEITELIHTAHLLQEGILDVKDSETSNLQFGNKMAVLSADLLLANACISLANLENLSVMELVSSSLADMAQGEFQKTSEVLNKVIDLNSWINTNSMISGSLLGKACQGALQLCGHSYQAQQAVLKFGKLLGLSWQGYQEINEFQNLHLHSMSFRFPLHTLPVILAVRNNPDVRALLEETKDTVKMVEAVKDADGINLAKKLSDDHASEAYACLDVFENCEAKLALKSIICL